MAKPKVNIAEYFADLTPKGPIRTVITEIELHQIDPNPHNFYSMDGIDDLADNIRMFGLMEPLIVKPSEGNHYMLISGHRRRAALRKLAEEGYWPDGMHHKVDCILHEGPVNLPGIEGLEKMEAAVKIYEQLQLIFANSSTREMSSADKAMQIKETRALLTQMRDLGYKLPGRMRDLVAETVNVSPAKIARLDVIDRGLLNPTIRKAWSDGNLSESSAYEIARREPDIQDLLTGRIGMQALCDMKTENVVTILDGIKTSGAQKKPDSRTVTIQSHDESKSAEEIAAAYRAASDMEDDILRDICRRNVGDIINEVIWGRDHDFSTCFRIPNIDAMRKTGNHSHSCGWHGEYEDLAWDSRGVLVRKLMEKDDKRSWVSFNRSWTDFYDALSGAAMQKVRKAEKKKNVSKMDTSAGWQKGDPPKRGRYLATVDLGGGELHEHRFEWTGDRWLAFGGPLDPAFKVVAWYPLPPEAPHPEWWSGRDGLNEG